MLESRHRGQAAAIARGTCPAPVSIKTVKGVLHCSSSTSGLSFQGLEGAQWGARCARERHQPVPLYFPLLSAVRVWHMLVASEGQGKAEDSPGLAAVSQQSHPRAACPGLDLPPYKQA